MKEDQFHAYCAGLFDGEGCIHIHYTTSEFNHVLRINIYNTHLKVLEMLEDKYGGYISSKRPMNRQCYEWRLNARKAITFLSDIVPFSIIKKRQIELAIEFYEKMIDLRYVNDDIIKLEEFQRREKIRKNIMSLNQNGS